MQRLLIAFVLALTMLAPRGGIANAQTSAVQPLDPNHLPAGVHMDNGFFIYEKMPIPSQAHRYILQGIRLGPDSCGFKEEVNLAPGSPTVAEQEIGCDPSTCQMIMARGLASPSDRAHGAGSTSTYESSSGNPSVSPLNSGNSTAHVYSHFSDVANITLTSLTDDVNWSWNGSCVTSGKGTRNDYWYSNDGWVRTGITDTFTPTCTNDEMDTNAHYNNGAIPGCATTYNDYWYNRIFGNANGSISAAWYATKSGPCANALTEHHDYGYGN